MSAQDPFVQTKWSRSTKVRKLIILLAPLLVAASSWAQNNYGVQVWLTGVGGIWVRVVVFPGDLATLVPEGTIQTDAEVRLRIARIPVLTQDEWVRDPKSASPHIDVTGAYNKAVGLWALTLRAECFQDAALKRNGYPAMASTWAKATTAMSGPCHLSQIRDEIKATLTSS